MWHEEPVWRGARNHMIHARVESWGVMNREQLWTRRLGHDRYEICCLPFLAYGIALGDEVRAPGDVFERVLTPSGRGLFRVAVTDGSKWALAAVHRTREGLRREAVLFEAAPGHALLAIDIADVDAEARVTALLEPEVSKQLLAWEVATPLRTSGPSA